ncbi:uncharacterized protein TNCV_2084911 [Trichonephila clavipes]|uniref:Uncharacterized protein n=1 Tax=Trichonephila clavipes TaxID=2585209 RepID=A0A8X6UWX9_TRICX|nr:uncharacterized protein TNCV_2084911 [Trichonephila clavipes]
MGHEDELTTELQEILNEEHEETQRNVSPSEQEEDKREPMPTSAIKDLLKKWADVRAMVLEWDPNQADVSKSACGEKFIETADIAVITFSSGSERVERRSALPMKLHVSSAQFRIICFSKHSRTDCEKPILQSSWHRCSKKKVSIGMRVLDFSSVGPQTCLSGPPVDRDRLNAYRCF